jgi:hypothetical protein
VVFPGPTRLASVQHYIRFCHPGQYKKPRIQSKETLKNRQLSHVMRNLDDQSVELRTPVKLVVLK